MAQRDEQQRLVESLSAAGDATEIDSIVLGETYHALGRSAEAIDVLQEAIAAADGTPGSIHQLDVGAAHFARTVASSWRETYAT
ncbi:MAG: hypothetical protein ACRDTA_05305 [Pseudonocardiaceae bacterium]